MNKSWIGLSGALIVVTLLSGCVTTGLSGVQRSLSTTTWGYQKVSSPEPVYLGKKSQRFEVRAGDCSQDPGWSDCKNDRERSEVTAENARFRPGSSTWISFLIYLPTDFKTSDYVNANLGQIHMKGGFSGTAGGYKSFPPLLQLDAKGDSYTACFHMLRGDERSISDVCDHKKIADLQRLRGKWSRVTIHLDAQTKSPKVKIFLDKQLVASFEQTLPRDPEYYYLKYGIYRSFVSKNRAPMPTQIVYYDEVKVGRSQMEVENESEIID